MASEKDLTRDSIQTLLENFFSGKAPEVGSELARMYIRQPDLFPPLLPKFVSTLSKADDSMQHSIFQLFAEIASQQPEVFTKKMLDAVSGHLCSETLRYWSLNVLDKLAAVRPRDVRRYDDKIIEILYAREHISGTAAALLEKLATDEESQRKYLAAYARALDKTTPEEMQISSVYRSQHTMLYCMRHVGEHCPKILAIHREVVEKRLAHRAYKEAAQSVLNVMDGWRTEEVMSASSTANKEQADGSKKSATTADIKSACCTIL